MKKLIYQKGIAVEEDLEKINLLDKMTYSDKYLLSVSDYKKRIEKNNKHIYIVKNSKRDVVAYMSIIPLEYDAYIRIKNGETDKEVITIDNIISTNKEGEVFYFDSIVVDPSYRRYGVGRKLCEFAINDVIKSNKTIKRIMAHTISKGGTNLATKYGLEIKKQLDKTTIVMERGFNKKSYVRKKKYKDRDKRYIEKKKFYGHTV